MKINNSKPTYDHREKTDSFYNSRKWKSLKDKVWSRDEFTCQICKEKGKLHFLQRGTKDIRFQGTVDHIVPRNAGGSDELDNLRLIGSSCHAKKSNKDKKYYR